MKSRLALKKILAYLLSFMALLSILTHGAFHLVANS